LEEEVAKLAEQLNEQESDSSTLRAATNDMRQTSLAQIEEIKKLTTQVREIEKVLFHFLSFNFNFVFIFVFVFVLFFCFC
jgi:hypothetical protein